MRNAILFLGAAVPLLLAVACENPQQRLADEALQARAAEEQAIAAKREEVRRFLGTNLTMGGKEAQLILPS